MSVGNFQEALQLHQTGRLAEAEEAYRSVLRKDPRNLQAGQLLGVLYYQCGRLSEAAALIETAIQRDGRIADFHNNLGEVYRQMGRLPDAVQCYRRALQLNPTFAFAHNNLGLALEGLGDKSGARSEFEEAIGLNPTYAEALINLGLLHQAEGNLPHAVGCFERAAAIGPQGAFAFNMLGQALCQVGRKSEALAAVDKAVGIAPTYPDAHYNRGLILAEMKRPGEALASFEKAAELRPAFAEAHNNAANMLLELKQAEAAEARLAVALRLKPRLAEVHNNLGLCAKTFGHWLEALQHFARALELKPNYPEALNNRGLVFQAIGDNALALVEFERAIRLNPNYAPALNNVGLLLLDVGQFSRAREILSRTVALDPGSAVSRLNLANVQMCEGNAEAAIATYESFLDAAENSPVGGSVYLYALTCASDYSALQIAERHREWARRYTSGLKPFPLRSRRATERLRVGYVSADLHDHSVARFLLPIFARHGVNFDILAYSDTRKEDAISVELKRGCASWRSVVGWNDDRLGAQIQADEVDILIDLSGHTARNRLLLFARRAAPLQVSYLGYPNTTGLAAMDYRIVDPHTDPPGMTDPFYTEKLFRLPETAWCYRPPADVPAPAVSEHRVAGEFWFGSFNNLTKISRATVELWSRVLQAIPQAGLLMKARGLVDPAMQNQMRDRFHAAGIARQRIRFSPWTATLREHFDYYRNVDVALDSFPYHGTTTTCDALWMGVPVISLAGDMHHSRVGVSLLTNVGRPEWVAHSVDDFVRIADELAACAPESAEARVRLRNEMAASPLRDEGRFVRNFEAALQTMWGESAGSQR